MDQVPAMNHRFKSNGGHHQNQNVQRRKFNGNCFSCGRRGHISSNCNLQQSSNGGRFGNFKNKSSSASFATINRGQVNATNQLPVLAVSLSKNCDDYWIGDSGAGEHMTPRRDWLVDYHPLSKDEVVVVLGNNSLVPAAGYGKMPIITDDGRQFVVDRVLHVPGLRRNLFSLSELAHKGNRITLINDRIEITRDNQILLTGMRINKGIYRMDFRYCRVVSLNSSAVSDDQLMI
jgi:hypothetical protein